MAGRCSSAHAAIASVTLLLALCAPARVLAAPSFLAPTTVSDTSGNNGFASLNSHALSMDAAGVLTLAWSEPWYCFPCPNSFAMAAQHVPGGGWSGPLTASAKGLSQNGYVNALTNAAGDGDVYFIHPGVTAGTAVLGTAHKPAGAPAFDPPFDPVTGLSHVNYYDFGLDGAGDTIGAILDGGAPATMYGVVRKAGGVSFDKTLLATGNEQYPFAAVNAAGDAVAAWREMSGGADRVVPAYRTAGGTWSVQTPVTINMNSDAGNPIPAIDGAGNAAIVFSQQAPGVNQNANIQLITKAAGSATWSGPTALTTNNGTDATTPTIAENARGDMAIAWMRYTTLQVAAKPAGGSFLTTDLGLINTNPSIAIDPNGHFMVAWEDTSSPSVVWATVRNVSTPPIGTNVQVSPDDNQPSIHSWTYPEAVMSSTGDGAVGFVQRPQNPPSAIDVVGYDASGPTFTNLNFPPHAAATVPFNYSVSPVDIWSPIGNVNWAFGDGSSADGASGSKAYAAEGAYTATVTATDAVGNSSQTTTPITVGAAPPPGAGAGVVDKTPPALTSVSLKPKVFAVDLKGKAETPVAASAHGTRLRYSLSEAARVVFTVQRAGKGRKVGRTCKKQTPKNRRKKACTRWTSGRRFALASAAGANKHRFSGRIGRRALKPGRYRFLLIATDAAGNKSATKRLTFKVVRR